MIVENLAAPNIAQQVLAVVLDAAKGSAIPAVK